MITPNVREFRREQNHKLSVFGGIVQLSRELLLVSLAIYFLEFCKIVNDYSESA